MKKIDPTISFRQDMIDLILAGKKTVTIRPIKPQPEQINVLSETGLFGRMYMQWQREDLSKKGKEWFCKQYPHGKVGDIVTIRERPEIRLKIVDIQAKRLHSISYLLWIKDHGKKTNHQETSRLHWQSFYRGTEFDWYQNPWVWIVEFELIEEKGQEDE